MGLRINRSFGVAPGVRRRAADSPAAIRAEASLGPLIAPRRNIADGWIAADEHGLVLHRDQWDAVRIPLPHLLTVELNGKELTLKTSAPHTYRLRLTTLSAARDLRFVEILARAARLPRVEVE
ncbi:hypothetical protein OKJ48_07470 [Streptomyces kunmingensis]|uniref:Uncharacterized protein n=1 Tax=Streptomyces kunmingensis TaxID=68225 RepID=A0ABU6C5U4_9ACTN|nr:hypothetical protein [Streptomyces kunmingensis]MEB3960089.1 hypothetical protein [Streptomyces kunmingensis]